MDWSHCEEEQAAGASGEMRRVLAGKTQHHSLNVVVAATSRWSEAAGRL